MKFWTWVAGLSLLCGGCSGQDTTHKVSEPADRPVVVASNYPLQYFAHKIAGPFADVRLAVPAGEDPAFWMPTAEAVAELQTADLVVLNGASYESWLKNVSLRSTHVVDTSESFKDQYIVQESTTHSHGPGGEHVHSTTACTTWLDLALAIEQARAIKDACIARWPEQRGQFEKQFQQLAVEIEKLDAEIRHITENTTDMAVLYSHPVYQYFERRYRLPGHSLHWEPDEMPTPAMWTGLTKRLGSYPAEWMIWEADPSPETRAKLAEQGIQSLVFDPCARAPAAGDFVTVMQQNIEALKNLRPQSAEHVRAE